MATLATASAAARGSRRRPTTETRTLISPVSLNRPRGKIIYRVVLTNGGGGVGDNTLSVVMLIYQYAFAMSGASNYNSASALGVVLMLVLAVFSGGFLWATRERG